MPEMSASPDALRADARWVRHVAVQIVEEMAETSWPTVRLEGSAAAAATVGGPPGLAGLAAGLTAWADRVTATADALERADDAAARGLSP